MRVRLTHALGSNEFELTPRGVDDPVVIGRSSDADLQVPSIEVSRAHAVMFVHDGVWVVQDSGSRDGTSVNGTKIDGPTRVNAGDRITLGAKAATVEVISLAEAVAAPSPVPTQVPTPIEPEIGALEASVPTVPYVRRHPKKNNANNVAIFAISCAVLIGVGFVAAIWGFIAYKNKVRANEALERQNAAAKTEVVVKKSESQRKTIFMDGSNAAVPVTPPPQANVPQAPVKQTPTNNTPTNTTPENVAPAPVAPVPVTPPEAEAPPSDPEWQRVVEFHDSSPPALAIYQYILYRDTNPAADKIAKIDAFQDEAIDLLWWQRVNDLVGQQTQIMGQIEDLKKEKAALPADATKDRREQFDKQVKHLESLHASNKLLLRNEMGFEGDKPVDLADEPMLKSLREKRDAEAYKRWTGRVLSRVKATRGASAW